MNGFYAIGQKRGNTPECTRMPFGKKEERKWIMNGNHIRFSLAGAGLALLTVLAATGLPGYEEERQQDRAVSVQPVTQAGVWAELDSTAGFVMKSFSLPAETVEHEAVTVQAPVVTEMAVATEIVSQPAVQPDAVSQTTEPDSQIMAAKIEPEPSEAVVELPVITAVESPGETQIDTITVNPESVPAATSTPVPIPSQTTNSTSQPIFSQTEQMASIQGGTTYIMGHSYTYLEQMIRYYNANKVYPSFYANTDAPTIEAFCQIYIEEAATEGIRAEVAFCQAMKETGFLTYTGDVRIEQFNFAGIGATGGGEPGNSFSSVRAGIRAQIQHLKAYASTDALNSQCVDPRFQYVKRGTTPYVEWLGIQENPNGGGWAAAKNYGGSIINDYIAKLFSY